MPSRSESEGKKNSEYDKRVNFVPMTYKQALADACRREKVLFIYLHCGKHHNTAHFCTNVLPRISDLVNNYTVPWGGSVEFSDAFKLSKLLDVVEYPCLAILEPSADPQKSSSELLEKIEGASAHENLERTVREVLDFHNNVIAERVSARVKHDERQQLRSDQDAAFARSVEEDHRRAEKQKNEEESKQRELREQQTYLEEIESKRANLVPEPQPNVDSGVKTTTVCFHLKNGKRFQRQFYLNSTLKELRDYVDIKLYDDNVKINSYNAILNYPKKAFGPDDDLDRTLEESGLAFRVILFIQEIED